MLRINNYTHKFTFITIVVLFIIVVSLFYWHKYSAKMISSKEPPVVVELAKAQEHLWHVEIFTTGIINAKQSITIMAEATGRITKTFGGSGQMVTKGDPIMQINPEGLAEQLERDKAQLELTKKQFDQISPLYFGKVASKAQYDQALANYQQAQAQLAKTQQLLNLTLIKAPLTGKLGVRLVEEGDFVKIGQPLITEFNNDELRVDFSVPAAYANDLAIGQIVLIQAQEYPEQVFTAKIHAINTLIDPQNNTILVRALLDAKNPLMPGTFVSITVQLGKQQTVITVPQTAIVYTPDDTSVYKVINGIATTTTVHLGERRQDMVAVTWGLHAGDTVVSIGKTKLSNGKPVVAANAK